MRSDWSHLEKFRHFQGFAKSIRGHSFGSFQILFQGVDLRIIATDGFDGTKDTEWEHVSVHAFDPVFQKQRIPTWKEMCFVKSQFWNEDETVVEYHPAKSSYVNIHD